MFGTSLRIGLSTGLLILGIEAAAAFGGRPATPEVLGFDRLATPAAMCGRTCQSGGRYIPGPPQVCYDQGLEFCGSSRGGEADGFSGNRGPGPRERGFAFDEGEYLRCHADVRRAVRRGEMESGFAHYRIHGRREGRELSC